MNPDQFPTDQNRIIAQLERRIADLETQVRQAQGLPIVQASGAFLLPPVSTPAAPPSGARLYATASGEARWRSSAGADYSLIPRATGSNPPDPTITLFNPPGSYSQAHIQTLVDTVESMSISYEALLLSLRTTGRIG